MISPIGGRDTIRNGTIYAYLKHGALKEGAGFHSKPGRRVGEEVIRGRRKR